MQARRRRLQPAEYSSAWRRVRQCRRTLPAEWARAWACPLNTSPANSNSGDLHAWVMWVEFKRVTPANIVFSLESHGRYNLDQYYVGSLKDPQTGRHMTDRELELTLQNIGANPKARRHAALLDGRDPELCEQAKMDVNGQLLFLRDVIRLSPGNEASWTRAGKVVKRRTDR